MKNLVVKENVLHSLKEHDLLTYEHSIRVAYLSRGFGNYLGLNKKVVEELFEVGLYHDIGKLYVDPNILVKKEKLNKEEQQQILNHTIYGEQLLRERGFSERILRPVRNHHENFDGTGYPDKLDFRKIDSYSSILRIIDSFDAMTSIRTYRMPLTSQQALDEIQSFKRKWYFPVDADEFCDFILSTYHS